MAAPLAKLWVELGLDPAKFNQGLATAKTNLQSWGKNLTQAGQRLTMGVTAPLIAGGIAAVKWASDLNEASSAVSEVFGKSASKISGFNGSVAKTLGLSRDEALSAAAGFGALYQAVGVTGDAAAGMSNQMVGAAADLGSFFNMPINQVLEDIKSGLVGQSEPLLKYGILLNEAAVAERALLMTGKAKAAELTQGEKVLARQELIYEGLGAAQGNFILTSKELANQQRITMKEFKDGVAVLGEQMLPLVLKGVTFLSKMINRFNLLSPATKKWLLIAAGVVAVIGPLLLIFGSLATALAGIITIAPVVGAAITLMMGPFGLLILAIGFLAVAWAKNWFDIRGKTKSAIGAILKFLDPFIDKFMTATKTIRTGMRMVADAFKKGGIKGALGAIFGDAGAIILKGLGRILGLPARIIGQFLREIKTGFAPLDAILNNFGAMFQDVGLIIQAIFSGQWRKAFQLGWDLIKRYVNQYRLIGELLLGVFRAIPWGTIGSALWNGLVAAVTFLVETGLPWLAIKGGELIESILTGMTTFWDETLAPWLIGLGLKAFESIGDLTETLLEKGTDLIKGIYDAANTYWDDTLWPWFSGLAAKIVEPFANIYWSFWNIGWSIISGLSAGIQAVWNTLVGWIDSILAQFGRIPDWLKPGSPSKTMMIYGKSASWGLAEGIKKGMPALNKAAGDMMWKLNFASSRTGGALRLAVMPAVAGSAGASTRGGVTFAPGAIVVNPSAGMNEERLAEMTAKKIVRKIYGVQAGAV